MAMFKTEFLEYRKSSLPPSGLGQCCCGIVTPTAAGLDFDTRQHLALKFRNYCSDITPLMAAKHSLPVTQTPLEDAAPCVMAMKAGNLLTLEDPSIET